MDNANSQAIPAPPSLTKSLLAGFDAVSNHIGLILFSIIFDLLLWLGPKFPLEQFLRPILAQAADVGNALLIEEAVKRLNLFNALRSYPIGIPSLIVSRNPLISPLGKSFSWTSSSPWALAGIWLLLTMLGLLTGTLYFIMVNEAAFGRSPFRISVLKLWPKTFLQFLQVTLILFGIIVGVGLPFFCVLTLLGTAGLSLGILMMIPYFLVMAWFLFPLVFSPHEILVNRYGVWKAIQESTRLVRLTLPTTGLFLLIVLVLSEGLDTLWKIPAESSWFSLIGIIGHAFVNAALLAASFVYFQQAENWLQRSLQQSQFMAIRRSK